MFMKKEIIKKEAPSGHKGEVESVPEKDLWENINPDARAVLEKIAEELAPHGLVKIRSAITEEGINSVTVRKISDNNIIYYSETPSEIEFLLNLRTTPEKYPK